MNDSEKSGRGRYRRVDQKLQDIIKRNRGAKKLDDLIGGTSEETAELFSSGTTPAVQMTIYTHAPADPDTRWNVNGRLGPPRVPTGHRLFTDGVTRPVYQDERGQFIEEDGERVDGVWLVPEEDGADTPVFVQLLAG
jgi:hypothetical protein